MLSDGLLPCKMRRDSSVYVVSMVVGAQSSEEEDLKHFGSGR